MRKESADEVAEAARRRLAELGRELARSGYPSADQPAEASVGPVVERSVETAPREASPPAVPAPVPEPGRHLRGRPRTSGGRATDWLQERLPATLHGRVSLGAGHVAVLAVVASVALAVTAYLTMR